jgi:hypothetical protein
VLGFSSDHGIPPIPEQAKRGGSDAEYIRGDDLKKAVEPKRSPPSSGA